MGFKYTYKGLLAKDVLSLFFSMVSECYNTCFVALFCWFFSKHVYEVSMMDYSLDK